VSFKSPGGFAGLFPQKVPEKESNTYTTSFLSTELVIGKTKSSATREALTMTKEV
jgi:hypothetical protein